MKKVVATFYLLVIFMGATVAQRAKKVLFIIADGIPADVLERVSHPHLQAIAKAGGYCRAYVGGEKGGYTQTPTISAVSYNSLLTGTWVNKHNVWGNDIKAPNYNYPTVFQLFKQQYPKKSIGIFSTWTDNRTKLLGEGLPQTNGLIVDYKADGYELDTFAYPHDKRSAYIHWIDEKVTDEADRSIREKAPDLSWLYLEYTDDMGHLYGNSPQLDSAVQYMDAQVGRVMDAINYRQKNFAEDWEIFVTTDHGRDSLTGKDHGGQSTRERTTWIVTNAKDLNTHFKSGQAAITDIAPTILRYLNVPIETATAAELDGTPLTGKISLVTPMLDTAFINPVIRWTPIDKRGNVNIWVATTNHRKIGGKEKHQLLATIPVKAGSYTIASDKLPATGFYKFVLQGPYNTVNRWWVR